MNPGRDYRYKQIVKQVRTHCSIPSHIIDAGCGTGQLLHILSQEFPSAKLSGFETSEEAISQTKYRVPTSAIYKIHLDNFAPVILEQIDKAQIVLFSEVLEHLDNPIQTLQWLKEFVDLDGYIIVTVPAGPMSFFDRFIGHRKHYSKKLIRSVFIQSGWTPIEINKSGFPGINLIRMATIFRGKRILQDLENVSKFGYLHHFFFRFCRALLWTSLPNSIFGWQLVAVAKPEHAISLGDAK